METHSMKFSMHCSWTNLKAMKFGGLLRLTQQKVADLSGGVAVIPNRFRFVITPLTVDCGIFRSEEISGLDLLHRRHPITVPCWNSLSSWERPILSQMFVETVCMPRFLLLYTYGHGSDWNTWFQLFGWVSTYFWQYSVSVLFATLP